MDELHKKPSSNYTLLKKIFPYVILLLITFALMFFFKHNKRDLTKMIEAGKKNLAALAQNLKPLFFQTEITDEDVFNFALYQSLPLDKQKNKVLWISNDESKNSVYEIRPAAYTSTKNYDTFIKYLGLNEKQKEEADSILNQYKKEIYSSVFVDEKNTFAVNPKLIELQQAILADLISFAQKVDENKSRQLFSSNYRFYQDHKISSLINSAKEIPKNEFILISPDTVAHTYFNWDKEKFNRHYADLEKSKNIGHPASQGDDYNVNFMKDVPGVHTYDAGEFDYSFKLDSNLFKVIIPKAAFQNISASVEDSIQKKLNEVAKKLKNIKIPVVIPEVKIKSNKDMKYYASPESRTSGQSSIVDPYEIVNKTFQLLANQKYGELEKFGAKVDSLAKSGKFKMKDSFDSAKFKEEMMKWKKEFKKFGEQYKDSLKVKK